MTGSTAARIPVNAARQNGSRGANRMYLGVGFNVAVACSKDNHTAVCSNMSHAGEEPPTDAEQALADD
jgi:hypothetical protein